MVIISIGYRFKLRIDLFLIIFLIFFFIFKLIISGVYSGDKRGFIQIDYYTFDINAGTHACLCISFGLP